MSATLNISAPESVVVHFEPSKLRMNDDEFYEFCKLNPDLRIERTREGDLIVMAPTGVKTGNRNFKLIAAVSQWVEADGTGRGFDSSTVFSLSNGAKRSPDLSWVRNERWDKLTADEQEQFPPLCPDFVIELRSRTDSLKKLQAKMEEYIASGAQL
ncbi:MAG: Uma2 family endonuclease, partial [Pyrinomonadaceae bacterium]